MKININSHSAEADQGWGSMYYDVIPSIIEKFGFKNFIEIGVAFAGHLDYILQNTNVQKAFGIDPYFLQQTSTDSFSFDSKNYDQNDYDNLYVFANERLGKHGNRVQLLRETSNTAESRFEGASIDIVFIDAEHTYSGVKHDIEIWETKVKKGGIISGHDYDHPNFPGVKNAVDEWCFLRGYKINVEKGYVWWVIKN
jgi:hypothetical protein